MSEMSDLSCTDKGNVVRGWSAVGFWHVAAHTIFFNMVIFDIFSIHHWYNSFDLSQHSWNSFKFITRLRDFLSKVDLHHTFIPILPCLKFRQCQGFLAEGIILIFLCPLLSIFKITVLKDRNLHSNFWVLSAGPNALIYFTVVTDQILLLSFTNEVQMNNVCFPCDFKSQTWPRTSLILRIKNIFY